MRHARAVVLCSLLLFCCALPSNATRAECPDPSDPHHCLDIGEECLSGRVSQCKVGLECPVEIEYKSFCRRTTGVYLQCKDPPVHCKREGDSCAPAKISECMPGLYCHTFRGKCVSGSPPTAPTPSTPAQCVHCKPLFHKCTLAKISECVPGLHCDKGLGICVARRHRRLHL